MAITASPYSSRHVARAGSGQPTTVVYRCPSYSGLDARESARHGMNAVGVTGKPVRLIAFAWGEDNVEVAAINRGKIPGNPWADVYSIRDGKRVQPANICRRELSKLREELDLTARLATHQKEPSTGQWLASKELIRNSYNTPLVVYQLATFPDGVNVESYAAQSTKTLELDKRTSVAVVFAYGTTASGEFGPAADILAFPVEQQTPENPDINLHTIVGEKVWQPAGICSFEADIATMHAKQFDTASMLNNLIKP